MPDKTNHTVLANAREYHAANAGTLGLPPFSETPSTLKITPALSKAAGRAYAAMRHDPSHPDVQAAYEAFKRETKAQYEHLVRKGVKMEPWFAEGQPYKNSDHMRQDVHDNQHLWYFPTISGFGNTDVPDNPLLERTGIVNNGYDQTYNDLFRGVHDYYGHALHGHQFGPIGEQRAWAEHARMFSPLARRAMTTETHGQNSWVNFGPHSWKYDGEGQPIPDYDPRFADTPGETHSHATHPDIPLTRRPYAEQKTGVIPPETHPERLARRITVTGASAAQRASIRERWSALSSEEKQDHLNPRAGEDAAAHKARVIASLRTGPKVMQYEQGLEPSVTPKAKATGIPGDVKLPVNPYKQGQQYDHVQDLLATDRAHPKTTAIWETPGPTVKPYKPGMEPPAAPAPLPGQPGAPRVKLARPEEHRDMIRAINANPKDETMRLVFADQLNEYGTPGEHVVRAHVARHGEGLPSLNPGYFDPPPTTHSIVTLSPKITPGLPRVDPDERPTGKQVRDGLATDPKRHLYPHVQMITAPGRGARLGMMHIPEAGKPGEHVGHFAHAHDLPTLIHLISDFPAWAQKRLLSQAKRGKAFPFPKPETPTKLAAMRAPSGGMIANNTFSPGGQFVGKALKRIRDVATRAFGAHAQPTKLARDSNRDPMIHAITVAAHRGGEGTLSGAFADHLDDTNTPGQHIVRAATPGDVMMTGVRGIYNIPNGHGQQQVGRGPNDPHVHPGEWSWALYPDEKAAKERRIANLHGRPILDTTHPGLILSAKHHKSGGGYPDGYPKTAHHAVRVRTLADIRTLMADFPKEHIKTALIAAARHGLPARPASGPTKLERPANAPPIMSKTAVLAGETPPREGTITLGQLKRIEDTHGLPAAARLSPHVKSAGDDHPFTAGVDHIANFFDALGKHTLSKGALASVLSDPRRFPEEKLVHLVSHMGHELKDFRGASKTQGNDWYGEKVNVMDRALHHIYSSGASDPHWGTLDSRGELVGKHNAAEHHPSMVLFKSLVAATSASQTPVKNLLTSYRMWNAGKKANPDNPIAGLPLYNHQALQEWRDKLDRENNTGVPLPPKDLEGKAKWYAKYVHPHRAKLKTPQGIVGSSSVPAQILVHDRDTHPHHGLLVRAQVAGKWVNNAKAKAAARSSTAKLVNVDLPRTDANGQFVPKGWTVRGKGVADQVEKIQALVRHFTVPGGTTLQAYKDAAKYLLSDHADAEVNALSKASGGRIPDAKRHRANTFLSPDERVPGSFMFGPKFGPFLLNLHMNSDATREPFGAHLTADKWWTRLWNRYLGRLVGTGGIQESPHGATERAAMREAAQRAAKIAGVGSVAELQADLWYYEQALWRMFGGEKMDSYDFAHGAEAILKHHTGKPVKLSRARPPEGWIASDGMFHQLERGQTHQKLAGKLLGNESARQSDAHAAGYVHVGYGLGEPGSRETTLHAYHPAAKFTEEQVRTFGRLAKEHGITSGSFDGAGKSRPVRLARDSNRDPLIHSIVGSIGASTTRKDAET